MPSFPRPRLRAHAAAAALLVLPLAAQSVPRSLTFEDPAVSRPALEISDARKLTAEVRGETMVFELEMAKPLVEGVFTCLHVYVDLDGKPETGIGGAEMWIRGAVGSRFRPLAHEGALGLGRLVRSVLRGREWNHLHGDGETVEVEGDTIRGVVPLQWFRDAGQRYGASAWIRAMVETSCSDQPVSMRHLCTGEFLPIEVDGSLDDWRGGQVLEDPVGELHADMQELDLAEMRIDHGQGDVRFAARFATAGFGDTTPDDDVVLRDAVQVLVDPGRPRYQPRIEFVIPRGRGRSSGEVAGVEWSARAEGGVLECLVSRAPGQNRMEVYLTATALRRDFLGTFEPRQIGWGER